jgi:arginyl-tRNA synthetase
MIERELARVLADAVAAAAPELGLDEVPERIEVVRPRQREHGDFATNVALALGPRLGRSPREVAETVVRHVPLGDLVGAAEVAGPGFINLTLARGSMSLVLEEVSRLGDAYGRAERGTGERIQVEFVSTNPTGPLHVGHGRNAAVGDALARVLEAAGYRVQREYYVNDAGRQADLFAASVEARYLEALGHEADIPEEGYGGAYLADLAAEIVADQGDAFVDRPSEERRTALGAEGIRRMLDSIRHTLDRMDVRFDTWVHESTLQAEGRIAEAMDALREMDLAYEHEGALWFRAERFGDEKDRVLIRANGEHTYLAADCAYLRDKFSRGFDRLVYVWGADHHGMVKRLQGAAQAFGHDVSRVEIILIQLVALYRDRVPARMSKRTGDIVTLDELLEEVGPDAARFTLLTRSTDAALDFDIELVKQQSLDNPVYYVQYAHARIASVLRYAEERGVTAGPLDPEIAEVLTHATELDLLHQIADLPEQVRQAAASRTPARLTRYVERLAAGFHRFYTECRVVTEDATLTRARLHLSAAVKQAIANVLALLGVSAPESMERLGEDPTG